MPVVTKSVVTSATAAAPTAGGRVAAAELTAGQARRIAIAAQQLATPLPPIGAGDRPINRGHLNRLLQAIGLLQIDSVNVLARAHLLPMFSRLGPVPDELLEGAAWPRRAPTGCWWRRGRTWRRWCRSASSRCCAGGDSGSLTGPGECEAVRRDHPGFLDAVLAVIDEQRADARPVTSRRRWRLPGAGSSGWWEWSVTKIGLRVPVRRRGDRRRLPARIRTLSTT